MSNSSCHSANGRCILMNDCRIDLFETKATDSSDFRRFLSDCTLNQSDFKLFRHDQPHKSCRDLPLFAATALASIRCAIASNVARTTFTELLEPSDLEMISVAPIASMIARTAPPAIIPVPGQAGLIRIDELLYLPIISCGSVPFFTGTITRFLFARSTLFLIASETSLALPNP